MGDDFVVDGTGCLRPVVGQGLAADPGAEEGGDVAGDGGGLPGACGRRSGASLGWPEVDHELVHAHASDEGRVKGAGGGVDDDARLVGGGAQDAVAVAKGDEADPAARGRDPGSTVRGRGPLFDDLDGGEGRAQLEGGGEAELLGRGHRRVGAQPVQANAGANHVVVSFAVPQDARRGGQVSDARSDARVGEDREPLLEDTHVARGRGVSCLAGVVGAGHVAPSANDIDEAVVGGHAQCRGQGGQVGERGARAGHAGVDLDVDAGGAADRSGGGADVGEDPGPRHRQVDVSLDRGGEVGGGGGNPCEEGRVRAGDAGLVEASAQRECLSQLGDAQPVGASLEGRERDGDEPVPVGVRLDGGELERVRGCGPQDTQVVLDGGQVDHRARRVSPSVALNVCDSHSPSISRESDRAAQRKPAASDALRSAIGQDGGNRGHNVAGLNGGAAVLLIRGSVGRAGVQTHGCR